MTEIKLAILAVVVVLVSLILSLNIGRTITLITAMKNGYCETLSPGSSWPAWQRCGAVTIDDLIR